LGNKRRTEKHFTELFSKNRRCIASVPRRISLGIQKYVFGEIKIKAL